MPSKTNHKDPAKSLAEITAPLLKKPLFTHVYAEAGLLSESRATVQFDHLPEDREIFDLSSLTKALVTAPLVAWTAEVKSLPLGALVEKWSKLDLEKSLGQRLTVEGLLMHRSGLPAWRNLYVQCLENGARNDLPRPDKILAIINGCAASASAKPTDLYSDLNYLLLTVILEEIWGVRIDEIWKKFVAEVLKSPALTDLGYNLTMTPKQRFVPTAYCPVRDRDLVGEVHDENTWSLSGVSGHAGLFGSGPAVANYLKLLANSDFGRRYFNTRLPLAVPGYPAAEAPPGFRVWYEASGAHFGQHRAVGHWGFTGTGVWLDLAKGVYGLLFTNRIMSGRVPGQEIRQYRADVYEIFGNAFGTKNK